MPKFHPKGQHLDDIPVKGCFQLNGGRYQKFEDMPGGTGHRAINEAGAVLFLAPGTIVQPCEEAETRTSKPEGKK